MGEDKKFLDTNILVYAYDSSSKAKHTLAQGIVLDLWESGLGVISTQVLQEFYVIVTAKIPKPIAKKEAQGIVNDLLKWDVHLNNTNTIVKAIELHLKRKYSFWDSMIIQAAIDT